MNLPTQSLRRAGRRVLGKGRRAIQAPNKLVRTWRKPIYTITDTPIFFVVGRSRSGTTWLMRLLNSHPELLCRGEGRFFGRDWRRKNFKNRQVQIQGSSLYNALAENEFLRSWVERSVWSREEDAEEHLNKLTRLAVYYFMAEKLAQTSKRVVGDKTPLLRPNVIEEISVVCPEAKVIHIIRDGRDATLSLLHYLWNNAVSEGGLYPVGKDELEKREAYRKDPERFLGSGESVFTEKRMKRAARTWAKRVGKTVEDGPALLGDNYKEVRYEDLLSGPEEQARQLFEFLEVEADEKTVSRCVQVASFERRTKGRKRGVEDSTSRGFRKGIAGDWRNTFTERDKTIFKESAGQLLIQLGYEKNNDW